MPRIIIIVPETNPQPYSFGPDCALVTLGRSPDNDIQIDSNSISQKHAEIIRVNGGYELRDTGSTNGLQVDGEYWNLHLLHHNDTVILGEVSLNFQLSPEEMAALDAERTTPIDPGQTRKTAMPHPKAHPPRPSPKPSPPGKRQIDGGFLMLVAALVLVAWLVAQYYNNGNGLPVGVATRPASPPGQAPIEAQPKPPSQPANPHDRPNQNGAGKEPPVTPPRDDTPAIADTNPAPATPPGKDKTPYSGVDRKALLNPADPNDKALLQVLEWKDYEFNQEVKTAYLNWAKARALRSIQASILTSAAVDSPGGYTAPTLDEQVPKDFLEWVDSNPEVATTIYGIAENADQRLVALRSLDLDLGKRNVRKDYTQLALALTDKYAIESDPVTLASNANVIGLGNRDPYKLEIPEAPMQPVDTKATDRTLDMEDHIINFLEDHAVPIGRKNKLIGDLDVRIAKGMGWWTADRINKQVRKAGAPEEKKSLLDDDARVSLIDPVKQYRRENPQTRPLYAYEVMTSPALQNEFNEYMKSKGFDVSINTGTTITGKTPVLAEVLKASAMFLKAYCDKGRLPKENDPQATPREMAAFLIRNDNYRFPNSGKTTWPRFDLNSPWPALDFLVSDRMPLRERQYIWELLRDHGIAEGYGEYLGDGIAQNPPLLQARKLQPYNFAYNTYPMMVKDGGVCGVMSQIGIRLNIALGIPAIHASQPGHACLVSVSGNEKSGFLLNIEQSAVGGPEETGVSGRGSYIQTRNWMYPLNYGFKQFLEAKMIHRLFTILPASVPVKQRLNLLGRGIEVNPFNFEIAGDYVRTEQDAKSLVDFSHHLRKKVHHKINGITNPDDYLQSVMDLVYKRLNEVPVPHGLLDTKYVADWLGDDRADPVWLKYGVAVHGMANFQAMIGGQLKQYLERRGGNIDESTMLAKRIQLVGNSISDPARRTEFGKSLHALILGHDMTRLDPITQPKRLDEKKQVIALGLDPDKYLVLEPYLPVIYNLGFDAAEEIRDFERAYEASVRGKRSKELSYVIHKKLLLLDTHIKDPAWRKNLGMALYRIIGGREIFAPETVKHSKLAMDPTIETIYSLGIDPTQAAEDITYTYSAALREPRTVDTAIALADFLAILAKHIQDPDTRSKLAQSLYQSFHGDKKFLVGPGIKSDKPKKGGTPEDEADAPDNGKKKKPLLDPAMPIIFELGVDINQVKKDIANDFDEYLRERRNTKSSKAFAEYLTLVLKHLPSPGECKLLGESLAHIISNKEIYFDPDLKRTELDATIPILYAMGNDTGLIQSQIEASLAKSVNGKRSLGSTTGLAKQIEAAGTAFPDKESRKTWGEKLLTIMQGKEQFTAYGNEKEKPKKVDDPCQQAIYSHLIMK